MRTAIIGAGGIARAHAEAVQALAEDVDVVQIATPPALHVDLSIAALEAGALATIPDTRPTSHAAPLREVVEWLRAGQRPLASGPEARRTVEFLSSLYKSAVTGQSVRRGSIEPGDPFYHGMAAVPA